MKPIVALVAWLVVGAILAAPREARAGDPYLEWWTLETPHFRVHYHGGLEPIAQRVGALAEAAHATLVPELGWDPTELTHIVLTDTSDFANGSATPFPYNTIRLFASAPEDMSTLGDYDDWLDLLVTHEHTHILHLDNTRGFSAVINAIFGKTYAPNQLQPRWITEGLAVYEESRHSTAGRLRSTQFDMYLRADVLEDRMATLSQMSHATLRWPGGTIWYLYGSRFTAWIADTYGPDIPRAVADDYASSVVPWGINRAIRRATGRTYEQLYEGFRAHLEGHYRAQVEQIERRGRREGRRLTTSGRLTLRPRLAPPCWSDSSSGGPKLVYLRNDGHTQSGIYELELSRDGLTVVGDPRPVSRATGNAFAFDRHCALVFDSIAVSRRRHRLLDLFRQAPGTRAPRGLARTRERLTWGQRMREPDLSPDGTTIAFVTNDRGTSTLRVADYDPLGGLSNTRRLVVSSRFEQAYTPRFSPDGQTIAYSSWTHGGFRDIRLVDVATGRVTAVTRDRALDQQPMFSADGRYLLFTSDRTGVANVYALDRANNELHQVTNVIGGAYMPELSSDGRVLYYAGYTADGFDLFAMPFDPRQFLEALPPRARPEASPRLDPLPEAPIERYQPWSTLRPRSYGVELGTGTFGTTLTLSTSGSDVVGLHAIAGDFSIDFTSGIPQGGVRYYFDRLPITLQLEGFHRAVPRGVTIGERERDVVEYLTGAASGVIFPIPGEFEYQSLALSYTAQHFEQDIPVGTSLDPYAPVPQEPHEGLLGVIHLGYSYSNAEWTNYGTGPERGISLAVGSDYASQYTGSENTLHSVQLQATGYLPVPGVRHHVLALGAGAGAAGGTYPRRGQFYTGGFATSDVLEPFTSNVLQGGFVLRGYEPRQFIGSRFVLLNSEYRFPIWYADRGLSTLPLFLRKITGTAFADYGGAFERLDPNDPFSALHLGVGGELWFDLVLGYFSSSSLRLGWAQGLDDEAPPARFYFVAASGF